MTGLAALTAGVLIIQHFPVISATVKRAFSLSLVGAALLSCIAPAHAEGPALVKRPVVLDAGHGGKDLGAVRRGIGLEKDLALAITLKVRDRLETAGIPTRLTRDADVFVPLDRRIKDSIDWGGSVFVSLHLNQERNKKADGIEVYAFGAERSRRFRRRLRRSLPWLPAPGREARAASTELASGLVRSLRTGGFNVEPVNKAAFYVLKNPKLPSVLVELGYLSNADEAKRLADPVYQEKLADTIAAGVRDYLDGVGPTRLASKLPQP